MSATLMGASFYVDLPVAERLLLLALADHANDDGASVWPGNDRLTQKTGQSVRNIRRLLRSLEDRGLIARVAHAQGGRGHAAEFALNADAIYAQALAGGWRTRSGKSARSSPFPPADPVSEAVKEDTSVPLSSPERRTPRALKEDMAGLKEDTTGLKGDTTPPAWESTRTCSSPPAAATTGRGKPYAPRAGSPTTAWTTPSATGSPSVCGAARRSRRGNVSPARERTCCDRRRIPPGRTRS